MIDHLFVYGTLLPDAGPRSSIALLRRVRRDGPASVRGALHDMGSFPALSLSDDDDDVVHGELLIVPSPSAWMRLDLYEGFDRANPQRSLYRRELVLARRSDGEEVRAWAYIYNKKLADVPRIEGGCWRRHLSQLAEIVIP